MIHSPEIQQFIKEKSSLFWYIPEDRKPFISISFLVETILNYGDEKDVKRLFDLIGIERVAAIFREKTSGIRINYFPQVKHYFTLYFNRYA